MGKASKEGQGPPRAVEPAMMIFVRSITSYTLRQTFPCVHHEGIQGSGDIAELILNLRNKWRRVAYFTPRLLYPGGRCYGIH